MPLTGSRMLLCEDSYFVADDLKFVLEEAGAQILGPFARAEDASAASASMRIDAAILDIELADGDVYPLARQLRLRGVPFIFFTGYCQEDLPNEFTDAACVSKPVTCSSLVGRLQALLAANDDHARGETEPVSAAR